jgi:hypothetical protein
MTPILSILIPTIPERNILFQKLVDEISGQVLILEKNHPSLGRVEILFHEGKRFLEGGLSIGKKCEHLVRQASGKYTLILHDDDWISPNFVESIVRLCQHDRDVCTFRSISKLDNFWMMVDMSLNYQNDQPSPKYMIRRKPFPICPVRSRFAKEFSFTDINHSEDFEWMEKVLTRCANEVHSEEILHEYRHSKLNSESDKITKHVQSK